MIHGFESGWGAGPYWGFHRVLRSGGVLAFQEPMAGPGGPPNLPFMWARDSSQSFLRTPAEMRALREATGFRVRVCDDVTDEFSVATPVSARRAPSRSSSWATSSRRSWTPPQRSRDERRMLSIHAVWDRA
jgi:hypothetical protein